MRRAGTGLRSLTDPRPLACLPGAGVGCGPCCHLRSVQHIFGGRRTAQCLLLSLPRLRRGTERKTGGTGCTFRSVTLTRLRHNTADYSARTAARAHRARYTRTHAPAPRPAPHLTARATRTSLSTGQPAISCTLPLILRALATPQAVCGRRRLVLFPSPDTLHMAPVPRLPSAHGLSRFASHCKKPHTDASSTTNHTFVHCLFLASLHT